MTRELWINFSTITLVIVGASFTGASDIPIYTVANMCNQTINMVPTDILMGILNFWYNKPENSERTFSVCKVSLKTTPRSNIGLQLLTSEQLPGCGSYVQLRRIYCAHNTTLRKEITLNSNAIVVEFFVNVSEFINRNEPIHVSVLIYTFSAVDVFGSCIEVHTDMQICDKSGRCLYRPLLNNLDQYDMCQSVPTKPPRETTENYVPEPVASSYTGVAVFVSSLFFLLGMLVLLQFFSRRQICQKCHDCLGLPVQETRQHRVIGRDAHRHRPAFTLGPESAPPPNYSDLSFHNYIDISCNQCTQETTSTSSTITSSNTAQRRAHVQTEISTSSQEDFTVPTIFPTRERRSASTENVSNTESLPPSYSDVVIHQEKYHVHDV